MENNAFPLIGGWRAVQPYAEQETTVILEKLDTWNTMLTLGNS